MKTKDHDEKILIKKKMHTLFTTAREIVSGVCICFLSHFDPDYVLLLFGKNDDILLTMYILCGTMYRG